MVEEVLISGDTGSVQADAPDPSFTFNTVFTNNILSNTEINNAQLVQASVVDLVGYNYSFDLFNSGSGGSAVASRGGTVMQDGEIAVMFKAAELQSLTNPNCRIDLVFPDLPATRPVGFENQIITAPNDPRFDGAASTFESLPGGIQTTWISRAGDTLRLEAEDQAAPGNPVTLTPIQRTGTNNWFFSFTAAQFDNGKTYRLTLIAEGADRQTATDTAPLTISIAADVAMLTGPTSTTSGPIQDIQWTLPAAVHSVFILGYTDPADPGGSDFASYQINAPTTTHRLTNAPTSGTYEIEFCSIPHNGSGGPDWANITKTIHTFTAAAAPEITNLKQDQLIADNFILTWTNGGITADSWRIKVGSTMGGSDYFDQTVSVATLSKTISGYNGQLAVHVELSSIASSVETVRDQFIVTAAAPSVTGYHNNIGTPTDSSNFNYPTHNFSQGRVKAANKTGIVIENFKIDNVTATQSHYEGGITLTNCHDITIRNGYINMPQRWLFGRNSDNDIIIYGGITLYKCSNITIENVNIEYAHSSLRIDTCKDITIRNIISKDCHQHHLQMYRPRIANGHRFTIEDFYGYRTGSSHPGSSMDGMNFARAETSGGVRASVSRVFIEVGAGTNGSFFIMEGPDFGKNIGNIDFTDMIGLNTNNKCYSHGGGAGNTYTRVWGFQDRSGSKDTPPNKSRGPWSAYSHDFQHRNRSKTNHKDVNFGGDVHTDCKTHWNKDGEILGFSKVYEKDNPTREHRFGIGHR